MAEKDEDIAAQMGMTLEQLADWRHVHDPPGFVGNYEFDLTFDLLGEKVTRRARAEYTFTPEWEYFDLEKQALFTGHYAIQLGLSVLTVEDEPSKMKLPRIMRATAMTIPMTLDRLLG